MARQVPLVGERPNMILDRVAVCACRLDRLGDRYATALAGQLQNRGRQFRQIAEKGDLSLDLAFQGALLLLQRS